MLAPVPSRGGQAPALAQALCSASKRISTQLEWEWHGLSHGPDLGSALDSSSRSDSIVSWGLVIRGKSKRDVPFTRIDCTLSVGHALADPLISEGSVMQSATS